VATAKESLVKIAYSRLLLPHASHGTSTHGEASKKPLGLSAKPTRSHGITG
jgi:hypothetical protein